MVQDLDKSSLLTEHKKNHFTTEEVVQDIIIGVSDGLTVSFPLAAGLSGAYASSSISLTTGIAEVDAGAISTGLGGYLAAQSEEDQYMSDLPHDMVLLISLKLSSSFLDMMSLKQVCSSWRIAMRNNTRTTYPMLVSLAKTEDARTKRSYNSELSLLSMNDEKKYKIKKSFWLVQQYKRQYKSKKFVLQYKSHYEFQKLPWFSEYYYRILGSRPDGWVIFSDQNRMANLLHLFLKIKIELPNMATNGSRVVRIPKDTIKKVILSNDPNCVEDFIVVMSISYCYGLNDKKLAFWRPGRSSWTCFGGEFIVLDIAFCENTVYAIRGCNHGHTYLESWDLKRKKYLPEKKLCIQLFGNHAFGEHLVVSSANEIFLWNLKTRHSCTKGIIYKLDTRKKECISVDSLNGRTLFSCFGDSVILSALDVERLGFKGNSIYFAKKDEDDIKLRIYSFDYSDSDQTEFQQWPPEIEPFGLFLLST